ncbi:MAG: DNA cytosine methyltransferase [Oscillospiraceae bacterium]|nr:DNA cytosine methyltransferase [Oscillospiraceae bacterium]
MSYKIFSFFSGSGFLDLGFEKSGYLVEFVNEFYNPFLNAYKYSREKMGLRKPKYGYWNTDINEYLGQRKEELRGFINDAQIDGSLVGFIGGPPCPDFSVAGKNRGRNGDNGKLSLSYVNLIIEQKPDFFLFENVKGLWKTARHRAFFEELKTMLHKAGYSTTERLTNSLEFGVGQDRDRILLVGIRNNLLGSDLATDNKILSFPWEKNIKYDLASIKNMPWPETTPYIEGSELVCPSQIQKELTVQYWFEKNDVKNHNNANDFFVPRAGLTRMEVVLEGDVSRKSYKRLHRWRYSPTVAYGNNEVHLHPYLSRRLSVSEALALQSLPKEFELPNEMTLSDMFKTVGNGVPYLLSKGIALTLKEYLEGI